MPRLLLYRRKWRLHQLSMKSFQIRPIKPEDNKQVADIIRTVMTEYGCVGDGYSINDPEVDFMYKAYDNPQSVFYVIENETNKKVLGCGGIAPLKNAGPEICELQKMYFLKSLRGHGMGQRLMEICIGAAIDLGYKTCYLETTHRMKEANGLYKKNGFQALKTHMGNTGHGGCDAFYTLDLKPSSPFSTLLNKLT